MKSSKVLTCKGCGRKVGVVRAKTRLRRKMVFQALGVAMILELIANVVVYIVFRL